MLDWPILTSALALGLASSLHCMGMCGPLALSLPYGSRSGWLPRLLYQAGRSVSYGALGVIIGSLGLLLSLASYQQVLSVTAGLMILMLTFAGHLPVPKLRFLNSYFGYIQRRLAPLLNSMQGRPSLFFAFGLLNGLLPCGVVYMALAGAAGTGDALKGAMFMIIFGLGTWPMMLALSWGNRMFPSRLKNLKNYVRFASVAVALIFILRGLDLGIPYLSPKIDSPSGKPSCCTSQNVCKK